MSTQISTGIRLEDKHASATEIYHSKIRFLAWRGIGWRKLPFGHASQVKRFNP